ncbi:hypothetical protein MTR67_001680 [Solanum verrucosum]|uniref:Tf2-1-like SH3-like domain-containing protein n=1 Tax=Solanum verrucosum TaxID=315347 RepID=A0AAF0PSA3_SOLVR|nr:hypothetical protein MTR67_001680 [Solanum verrucosum]
MSPYDTLYRRRCRSPIVWFEIGEAALIEQDSVSEAIEEVQLIRDRLKIAQSRETSYEDVRKRDLGLEINDWVFLKVSPMKGVMRFSKKGKLSPRYVGPYTILKRIGNVAYELKLQAELAEVHPILDRQVRRLRNKEVATVKVLWRSQSVEGATWEAEATMMAKYPHLFPSDSVSS